MSKWLRFTALLTLLLSIPLPAQEWDFSPNDESRLRTRKLRDARKVIDNYDNENWRAAAYVLAEVTPNPDATLTLRIEEKDRQKLLSVDKGKVESEVRWTVEATSRVKLEVNYYQSKQEVACSIPKKLKGKAVTLGVFNVYDTLVECFVRPAAAG